MLAVELVGLMLEYTCHILHYFVEDTALVVAYFVKGMPNLLSRRNILSRQKQ